MAVSFSVSLSGFGVNDKDNDKDKDTYKVPENPTYAIFLKS